jgi:hypothetical protein
VPFGQLPGFGAFETPFEWVWADHLIAMQPHVSLHVNGAFAVARFVMPACMGRIA